MKVKIMRMGFCRGHQSLPRRLITLFVFWCVTVDLIVGLQLRPATTRILRKLRVIDANLLHHAVGGAVWKLATGVAKFCVAAEFGVKVADYAGREW